MEVAQCNFPRKLCYKLCHHCLFWKCKLMGFLSNFSAGTIEADTIDQRIGNTNSRGVWFFRLDNNTILDLPAKKCYTWIRQQGTLSAPEIRPCPCTLDQAIADKQFYVDYGQKIAWRSNQTICAYSLPSLVSRWAQQCCYTDATGSWKSSDPRATGSGEHVFDRGTRSSVDKRCGSTPLLL